MSEHHENNLTSLSLTGQAPPSMVGLSQTLQQAREFASRAGVEDLVGHRFLIVVEELVTNVVTHGQPERGTAIDYEFLLSDDTVKLRLSDAGTPFDPRQLTTVQDSGNGEDQEEGGWGWPLILKWCDLESYQRVDGRNVLDLRMKV